MRGSITLAALAVVAAAATGGASAQQKAAEFRYTTGAPPNTPWVMQLDRFAKDLDEESKSAMKIVPFINAQLGNEQDTMQQVARGRIDMGGFSVAAAALLVPELSLTGLPFYFTSAKQQDCVYDNHLTNYTRNALAQKGVVFLGWTHVGSGSIVGKKAFKTPAEVKGLKARSAPTKTAAAFWTALGANPNPIGITEWSSAHQTGLVDVSDAPVTFYVPSGLGKIAPVYTRTNHYDAGGVVVIAKGVYDKMTADQRNALQRAVDRRPGSQLRGEIRGFEETILGMHLKAGGQIVTLTPAERLVWQKAVEPAWPQIVKSVGGDSDKFFKLMEDGKKACGA
ncbi:MAG: TRAP transporter substrate-binding protein [Rhodospirillales bacterium]|nr:MAG: TRAP transporter substrate-binding protein [Rhodospirillales bacterium]